MPTTTKERATSVSAALARLKELDREHGEYYNALTDGFVDEMQSITTRSVASLTDYLRTTLTFTKADRVVQNQANLATLRATNKLYEQFMTANGFDNLTRTFVNQFPNQLPTLYEELDIISAQLQSPLVVSELLTADDISALATQQRLTRDSLQSLVETVANVAKRKTLVSLSALDMKSMTEMLSLTLNRSVGESKTLAATSSAMFYRTANARAMDRIDERLKSTLRYVYDGPLDVLTRPFCQRLRKQSDAGKSWTRQQIEAMDNEQLPDPFQSCGGYNCRHQWRVALAELTPPPAAA